MRVAGSRWFIVDNQQEGQAGLMRVWSLRLILPLLILLQVLYAAGWAYLSLSWPAEPEDSANSAIGTVLYICILGAPVILLIASAVVLAIATGRSWEMKAIWVAAATEVVSIISGIYSGGILLSAVGLVVLAGLGLSQLHHGKRTRFGPRRGRGQAIGSTSSAKC